MKTLVKKSIVLVLVSLFMLNVSAQRPNERNKMNREEAASKHVEMMTKLLDLSAEQQLKIKEINLKHFQQMADREKKNREEMRQNREDMKTQMEARDAELKQVLTPEQYEKWQEKRKEMRRDREGNKRKFQRAPMTKKNKN